MAKTTFPHDMSLKRLKRRRRFLKRSIRRARRRIWRLKRQGKSKQRVGRAKSFLTNRRKQLRLVEYAIRRRRRTLREILRIKKSGFRYVNGKLVCGWIADELDKARSHGWRGYVVSGYRTPSYSISLCRRMCGRNSCPGRCAGAASNHARGPAYPGGAVDVTDYWRLQQICKQYHLRIHNGLGSRDPVHFSSSGA